MKIIEEKFNVFWNTEIPKYVFTGNLSAINERLHRVYLIKRDIQREVLSQFSEDIRS